MFELVVGLCVWVNGNACNRLGVVVGFSGGFVVVRVLGVDKPLAVNPLRLRAVNHILLACLVRSSFAKGGLGPNWVFKIDQWCDGSIPMRHFARCRKVQLTF